MEMGCWTSSCHMESPWLSHCLSSGEIRCAPTSGPLAPSLVCSQWPMKARNLGLLASMMGSENWTASDRKPICSQPKVPYPKESPAQPSAFCHGNFLASNFAPQSFGFPLPAAHIPLPFLVCTNSPSSPLLLLSSSSSLPPCSMPTRLMPTTFLLPGLQQQLVTCGAPHPVWGLRQGCQGCTLHQEEWGTPTDH